MSIIDKRYATALVETAYENNILDEIEQQFEFVLNQYTSNSMFKELLNSPAIQLKAKKKVLTDLLKDDIHQSFLNFLCILLDKYRITNIKSIYTEFIKLSYEKRHVLDVNISSAYHLTESQIDKLKARYKKEYDVNNVNIHLKINPSLLGGLKIQINDKLTDFTLLNNLSNLERNLMKS